jgi:hypothetical protein
MLPPEQHQQEHPQEDELKFISLNQVSLFWQAGSLKFDGEPNIEATFRSFFEH